MQEQRGAGRRVPERELSIKFVRSGGAGGQKVNKTSSQAQLRWHVGDSAAFSPEEKALIREKVGVNKADEVELDCDEQRSQGQNKELCIKRLNEKVAAALVVPKEREATEAPKGVKARNANSDYREKIKKAGRGRVDERD